jgi:hypothetical protein
LHHKGFCTPEFLVLCSRNAGETSRSRWQQASCLTGDPAICSDAGVIAEVGELRRSAKIKARTMAKFTIEDVERLAARYSIAREKLGPAELKQLVDGAVRFSKELTGTEEKRAPDGYLSLREIENSLERRMWAGIGRAALAEQVRRDAKQTHKRSLGLGARRDRVATSLQAAFLAGKLTLYVAADETRFRERFKEVPSWTKEPMPVPKELLGHVFVKGRLSGTLAIRPSRKLVRNDQLFALLNCGHLVVRESDYKRWGRSERRKRRWPSQNRSDARPTGRPKKSNSPLRNAILEITREQVWNGELHPIAKLQGLLKDKGMDVPSVDTFGRLVDELFAITGEPSLRRRHRARRKCSSSALTAKYPPASFEPKLLFSIGI